MAVVGESVLLKRTLMVGVVLAEAKKKDFFVVLAYDTDSRKYTKVEEHQLNMETLTIQEFVEHVNFEDKAHREDMFNQLADMALDMGDKEWFDEIAVERKRYRRPAEESDFEKNRVKPGQMVVDNNGKNSGVVLCRMKHKPGKFLVRTFDANAKIYVQVERMASQLKVLHVPSWNKDVNHDFKETNEIIRELCSELAVATNDDEWLIELNTVEQLVEDDNYDGA